MNDQENDWLEGTIRREGSVMFSSHPSAAELTLFTEAVSELPSVKRQEIEAHLRVCAACEDDRARLIAAKCELSERKNLIRQASSIELLNRLREWISPSRWVPVVAVVAVTIAILVPNSNSPIVLPVGPAIVLRGDVERGAMPTVIAESGDRLTFSFVLPGTNEGSIEHCDVTIVAADGEVVTSVLNVSAFDDYGTFLMTIDTQGFTVGSYTLVTHDRIGTRHFGFNLQYPSRETEQK